MFKNRSTVFTLYNAMLRSNCADGYTICTHVQEETSTQLYQTCGVWGRQWGNISKIILVKTLKGINGNAHLRGMKYGSFGWYNAFWETFHFEVLYTVVEKYITFYPENVEYEKRYRGNVDILIASAISQKRNHLLKWNFHR